MPKILQTRTSPSAAWRLYFDGFNVNRGIRCLARMLLSLKVFSFCHVRDIMGLVGVNDDVREHYLKEDRSS